MNNNDGDAIKNFLINAMDSGDSVICMSYGSCLEKTPSIKDERNPSHSSFEGSIRVLSDNGTVDIIFKASGEKHFGDLVSRLS